MGAKIVPFAGYNMPVQYEGVNIEHETVRNAVGVFDVSHMGEFLIEGPHALELIQKVTSNDASKLTVGKAQYSCLPNDNGGIIDDLIVYRVKEETYLLVVNASNIEKDWNWIASKNDVGATMRDLSEDYSLLAIQGPKAVEAMQSLTSHDLSEIKFYNFVVGDFAGIEHVIISATGYTGSGGFEIYCKNSEVKQIWDNVFEAGLGWITKFTKTFTNSDKLSEEKKRVLKRKLIAFELDEKGIPRSGYDIVDNNGKLIGKVTSGTMSPSLKKGIGLGYVAPVFSDFGSKINIQIRKNAVPATVVKLPFYKG
jgi:aminomethyltransferase